jgi:hypothetical protein
MGRARVGVRQIERSKGTSEANATAHVHVKELWMAYDSGVSRAIDRRQPKSGPASRARNPVPRKFPDYSHSRPTVPNRG